jgi:uncharacterized protein (TIGR03067 family)
MRKIALILLGGLLLAADAPKGAVKKDLDKLKGAWKVASAEYDGQDVSNDGMTNFKLVFKGDKATIEGNDEVKKGYAKMTFKLDPSTKPKSVDIHITSGEQKDNVIEGIYELKGNEFKICAKLTGKERPTKFATAEGTSTVLVVFKRDTD